MASPLGFFADVIRTGTVLCVDWTFSPDEVTQALGIDPAINRHAQHVWHDYGLVEFFWERVDGRWRGTHFSVQVHRLDLEIGYQIPQVVAEHGTPPERVAFDALAAELTVPLVPVPSGDDDLNAYWQPDSTALVLVAAGNPNPVSHTSTVAAGHVYRITAPHHAPDVDLRGVASTGMGAQAPVCAHPRPARSTDLARPAADRGAHKRELVVARVRSRRWTDPGTATPATRLGATAPVAARPSHRSRRPRPTRTRRASRAIRRRIARPRYHHRPRHHPDHPRRPDRRLLAAIPVTPAEAMAIDDWRAETLDTMRRLRRAKNLINAVENFPARLARNSLPTSTSGSDLSPG